MTTETSGTATVPGVVSEIVNKLKQQFTHLKELIQASNRREPARPLIGEVDGMLTQYYNTPTPELVPQIKGKLNLLRTECQQSDHWEQIRPAFVEFDGAAENFFTSQAA